MATEWIITLPDQWVTATNFEQALQRGWSMGNMLFTRASNITFRFPPTCKIMVDAAARLLSLANQLTTDGVHITFVFEGKRHEALSYLNRANFFPLLSEQVQVIPGRPDSSLVAHYQEQSPSLVEFKALHPGLDEAYQSVRPVPHQLAASLDTATGGKKFGHTPYTIFAELINNVYDHSQTKLDGFAALQVYRQGGKVQIVVSDSGIGILETLKPKLLSPQLKHLEDAELIRLLFNGDLTWKNAGNGQGLQVCAFQALKYGSSVSIRLSTCGVHLNPSSRCYDRAHVQYQQNLVPLKGTHICFSFPLDITA